MSAIRKTFKNVLYGISFAIVAPLSLSVRAIGAITRSDSPFQFGSQLVALLPGIPGDFLRRAFYVGVGCSRWPGPTICFGTIVGQRSTRFGKNVYVGGHCCLGAVEIGDFTLLGSGVHIASPDAHRFNDPTIPVGEQGGTLMTIRVGRSCWLGNASVVLADIEDGAVIGAGTVVTKICVKDGVFVGNPARFLRSRLTHCPANSEHNEKDGLESAQRENVYALGAVTDDTVIKPDLPSSDQRSRR